eukprot:4445776-Lingulodinium_polyedra.AAC.1
MAGYQPNKDFVLLAASATGQVKKDCERIKGMLPRAQDRCEPWVVWPQDRVEQGERSLMWLQDRWVWQQDSCEQQDRLVCQQDRCVGQGCRVVDLAGQAG